MTNDAVMLEEEVERYDTSAIVLTHFKEITYTATKKQETATTDIISEEVVLEAIKNFIERIMSIFTIEDIARVFERVIRDFYLFDEVRLESIESLPPELVRRKYPEIVELSKKLKNNEELTKIDEWNLDEITKASGWDKEDVVEELINLDIDPSEREERYWRLFEKYYREANELKEKGDDAQAAEKLWGAITALIKAYSARMGIYVAEWDHETLWNVVYHNFPQRLKSEFRELLNIGNTLHRHFYEQHLPPEAFKDNWELCITLINKILRDIRHKM